MTFRELATNPLAVLFGTFAAGWTIVNVGLVHSFGLAVWASAGPIFTLVSIGALTLPPHLPPESTTDWLVLGVGALFIAKVGARIWYEFDSRIDFDLRDLIDR